mmetsp:Transcript_20167/g.24717  ORF Transcript_20167/g.24717 Transcript_20167/m.24717 type:complete len:86 (+) Transcript_20167:291-548(+)
MELRLPMRYSLANSSVTCQKKEKREIKCAISMMATNLNFFDESITHHTKQAPKRHKYFQENCGHPFPLHMRELDFFFKENYCGPF